MTAAARPVGDHAVVLGASMAGLVAARVLSERFARVTLVDRDELPAAGEHRVGVPQAHHAHGLLCGGRATLEELFPGLTDALAGEGAPVGDPAFNGLWFNQGSYARRVPSGLLGVAVTRPALEAHVRRRVLAMPGLILRQGTDARGLVASERGDAVVAVRLSRRGSPRGALETLPADLVVDATGRGSRTPAWLAALGYPAPADERVAVGIAYTTRFYRRSEGTADDVYVTNVTAHPPNRRIGVALAVEGNRLQVTLAGYLGEQAPPDVEGFSSWSAGLPAPDIHELVSRAEPIGDAVQTRFPASRRRRYERLPALPHGLVVMGDALCSFNPVYGQGMSVAAAEAALLGSCLDRGGVEGLGPRFFRAVRPVVDVPWDIAVGGDLRFPEVEGPRGARVRFVNYYLSRLIPATASDPAVARAFHEVANLTAPPAGLLHPRIVRRVAGAHLRAALAA